MKQKIKRENLKSKLFKEFLLNKQFEDLNGNLLPIIQKFRK